MIIIGAKCGQWQTIVFKQRSSCNNGGGTHSFCASMMIKVESLVEAVEGFTPMSSRNDLTPESPIVICDLVVNFVIRSAHTTS